MQCVDRDACLSIARCEWDAAGPVLARARSAGGIDPLESCDEPREIGRGLA